MAGEKTSVKRSANFAPYANRIFRSKRIGQDDDCDVTRRRYLGDSGGNGALQGLDSGDGCVAHESRTLGGGRSDPPKCEEGYKTMLPV